MNFMVKYQWQHLIVNELTNLKKKHLQAQKGGPCNRVTLLGYGNER
jgi:hypothetical protein